MKDLFGWQEELKRKEKALKKGGGGQGAAAPLPPVRGRAAEAAAGAGLGGAPAPAPSPPAAATAAAAQAAPQQRHPAGHTYEHYREKWEKFDVEAALASSDEEDAGRPAPAQAPPAAPSAISGSGNGSSEKAEASSPSSSGSRSAPTPAARLRVAAQAAAARPAQPTSAEGWKEEGNRLFKAGKYQQVGGSACRTKASPPARACHQERAQCCSMPFQPSWQVQARTDSLPPRRQLLPYFPRMCLPGAQALECYSASLGLAPSCLAYANRAMAELKLGRWAEAEADCTQALALDPGYVKAYQRR